jgi:hypothetical protein
MFQILHEIELSRRVSQSSSDVGTGPIRSHQSVGVRDRSGENLDLGPDGEVMLARHLRRRFTAFGRRSHDVDAMLVPPQFQLLDGAEDIEEAAAALPAQGRDEPVDPQGARRGNRTGSRTIRGEDPTVFPEDVLRDLRAGAQPPRGCILKSLGKSVPRNRRPHFPKARFTPTHDAILKDVSCKPAKLRRMSSRWTPF